MLVELHLRNLAVAADVSLTLGPGLNVLTGTTGAGKSLVVQALRWISGADIDRQMLRTGADVASAEAVFDLDQRDDLLASLVELGIDLSSDGILQVRRELRREGRSRAIVNGRTSSAATLQQCARLLVEMQSQHEQLSLRQPSAHASILDRLGVDETIRASWSGAYDHWREVEREIERNERRQARLREDRDLLDFQLRELLDARLTGDEMEGLAARVALHEGGAQLLEAAAAAQAAIESEDTGALRGVGEASAKLKHVPAELVELAEAREAIDAAEDLLHDALRTLERFADRDGHDPAVLAADQERLAQLQSLCRKYSMTETELSSLCNRLESELGELGAVGDLPPSLAAKRDQAVAALQESADSIEKMRRRVARRVERNAPALLDELGMKGAGLRFDFVAEAHTNGPIRLQGRASMPTATGPTSVRIVVQTNPGERPGPLERIASGGELSRIGLVLRSLGQEASDVALLVLDEVDAGLGADLGPAMARRLHALAQRGQVLVISHLASVAAAADVHLVAAKSPEDDRTESRIEVVDAEPRVRELQRMLGATNQRTEELAVEMLRQGRGRSSKEGEEG